MRTDRDALGMSGTAALVAGSALLATLAWPALSRRMYVMTDLADQTLPVRAFYARALAVGDNFSWFPNAFTGYYVHGDAAFGLLHPLNLLAYFWLPLDVAFNLELLRNYALLFPGMFLFLRRWDVRRDASLFGALLFTFCGFNLLHHMHTSAVLSVAHIPWLLWATDVALRGRTARARALGGLGVAAFTASELLVCYPQYVLFSMLAEAGYVLVLWQGDGYARRTAWLAAMKLCGVAAGAVQLIPLFEGLSGSLRADPAKFGLFSPFYYSLEPINLVQLVAPYLFANRVVGGNIHEFGLYAGAVAPLLCFWLLLRRRALGPAARLAVWAALLGSLALVLALGRYGQLYRLQAALPLLGVFRAPCRYIVLVHLSVSVLAALGFHDLARRVEQGECADWRSLRPLALIPAASLLAIALGLWWQESEARPAGVLAAPYRVLAGPLLVSLAALAVVGVARLRLAPIAIVLLAAADQGLYGLSYVRLVPPQDLASLQRELHLPSLPPGGRVSGGGMRNVLVGVRNLSGYAALRPRRPLGERVMAATGPSASLHAALRVAGVDYHWSWTGPRRGRWVRVPDPLPRARLLPQARLSEDPWRDLVAIDVETTALVAEPLQLEGGAPGNASIERDRPGEIRVATEASSRQLLVVSESYHDGWRASVDGRPVPVVRVYGDFIGCVVDAGSHRIDLVFAPWSLRAGVWISVAGVLMALALWALARARAEPLTGRPGPRSPGELPGGELDP